jgi:hypothetical protein
MIKLIFNITSPLDQFKIHTMYGIVKAKSFSSTGIFSADRNNLNHPSNPTDIPPVRPDSVSSMDSNPVTDSDNDDQDLSQSRQLAEKFNKNAVGLIEDQNGIMDIKIKESRQYIKEVCEDRAIERSTLPNHALAAFDKETLELIESEAFQCDQDLDHIAGNRDDALDTMQHRATPASSFSASNLGSSIGSNTTEDALDNAFANIDTTDAARKNEHALYIAKAIDYINGLPENELLLDPNLNTNEQLVVSQSDNSDGSSPNSVTEAQVEANALNSTNVRPTVEISPEQSSSNKRKYEDLDDKTDNKKVKLDYPLEKSSYSTTDRTIGEDNKSPMDFVLDKQQSEPYDFTDDIE